MTTASNSVLIIPKVKGRWYNIGPANLPVKLAELHMASIVIVKDKTHFKCIKNRYGSKSASNERIPLWLLEAYLSKYNS